MVCKLKEFLCKLIEQLGRNTDGDIKDASRIVWPHVLKWVPCVFLKQWFIGQHVKQRGTEARVVDQPILGVRQIRAALPKVRLRENKKDLGVDLGRDPDRNVRNLTDGQASCGVVLDQDICQRKVKQRCKANEDMPGLQIDIESQ